MPPQDCRNGLAICRCGIVKTAAETGWIAPLSVDVNFGFGTENFLQKFTEVSVLSALGLICKP